jgi:hypothetical protein
MIERYIGRSSGQSTSSNAASKFGGAGGVSAVAKRKRTPRAAETYRAFRRNKLKNTQRVRMSRAERLAQMQGPAKYIERKE